MFLSHFEEQHLAVDFYHFHDVFKIVLSQQTLLGLNAIAEVIIKRSLNIWERVGIVSWLFFLHLLRIQPLQSMRANVSIQRDFLSLNIFDITFLCFDFLVLFHPQYGWVVTDLPVALF